MSTKNLNYTNLLRNSDTEAKDIGGNLNYFAGDRMSLNFSAGYHEDDTGLPGAIKASDFAAGTSRTDTLYPDNYADVEDYYLRSKIFAFTSYLLEQITE